MQNIIINCYDDQNEYAENIEYSKHRFMFASNTFRNYIDEPIRIPSKKHSVELFLNFLDDYTVPDFDLKKENNSKDNIIQLLNVAQYCELPDNTIPGKNFLLDIVYEKILKAFDIQFKILDQFVRELELKLYDYNSCRTVLQNINSLIFYKIAGIGANSAKWRALQIQRIKNKIATY